MKNIALIAAATSLIVAGSMPAHAAPDAEQIFSKKCSMCHKIDSKKVGPAVKDMNRDPAVLRKTISEGRKMMPKFGAKLSAEEIDALVAFIQSKQPEETANPCAKNPCGQ
ncbi:MAG: cytochrome c [Zetaproteobacteria bacterium]|nr:MAG: cytochrome c [Zetaproteobacteria bacterium]